MTRSLQQANHKIELEDLQNESEDLKDQHNKTDPTPFSSGIVERDISLIEPEQEDIGTDPVFEGSVNDESLLNQIDALKKELDNANAANAQANEDFQKVKQTTEDKLADAQEQLNDLKSKNHQLEDEKIDFADRNDALAKELDQAQNEVGDIKAKNRQLEDENHSLNDAKTSLAQELDNAQNEIDDLKAKVDQLEDELHAVGGNEKKDIEDSTMPSQIEEHPNAQDPCTLR